MIVYPHCIRNRSQWNALWRDNQPHGYSRPILFPHSTKRMPYCRQIHMTAGKIYHGCFEMFSWPQRSSNHIINICFWLLDTCTKCSYFIEENMRPGAQRLAFEVKYEYIVHCSTNTSWAGCLRLGKFPDNRRLMCSSKNEYFIVVTVTYLSSHTTRAANRAHSLPTTGHSLYTTLVFVYYKLITGFFIGVKCWFFIGQLWYKIHWIFQARAANAILHDCSPWKAVILFWHSERIQHRSTTVTWLTWVQGCEHRCTGVYIFGDAKNFCLNLILFFTNNV